MGVSVSFLRKLEKVPSELREILIDLIEEVERSREVSITKGEFQEFAKRTEENFAHVWEAIRELTEAQKGTEQRLTRLEEVVEKLVEVQRRTEQRVSRLEQLIEELAEAQKRTEQRVNELAEAQKRTEQRINELTEAQKRTEEEIRKLSQGQRRLRQEVGGLGRSVAYALENEAFRRLPQFLAGKGIEVLERMVRREVAGEEINLFARVKRDREEMWLVGEAVLRLDDPSKLRALKEKALLVQEEMGGKVLPLVVTHFAKGKLLERAKKADILVVQSFEMVGRYP